MDVTQVDVDAAVQVLRPDFVAIALLVSGIRNAPTDAESEAWLAAAEAAARVRADRGIARPPRGLAGGLSQLRREAAAHALLRGGARGSAP